MCVYALVRASSRWRQSQALSNLHQSDIPCAEPLNLVLDVFVQDSDLEARDLYIEQVQKKPGPTHYEETDNNHVCNYNQKK